MEDHNDNLERSLIEAYDTLIEALRWQRDRALFRARRIAQQFDQDRADEFLRQHTVQIRHQSDR